jgi:hypothetical protein
MHHGKIEMSSAPCFFLVLFGLPVVGVLGPMKTSCSGQKQMMPPRCRMFILPTKNENTKPVFQLKEPFLMTPFLMTLKLHQLGHHIEVTHTIVLNKDLDKAQQN